MRPIEGQFKSLMKCINVAKRVNPFYNFLPCRCKCPSACCSDDIGGRTSETRPSSWWRRCNSPRRGSADRRSLSTATCQSPPGTRTWSHTRRLPARGHSRHSCRSSRRGSWSCSGSYRRCTRRPWCWRSRSNSFFRRWCLNTGTEE